MDVIPKTLFPKAPVRSADLIFILDQIAYGHHCALLGVSNSGKSALLNSLTTPATNQALATRLALPSLDYDSDAPTADVVPLSNTPPHAERSDFDTSLGAQNTSPYATSTLDVPSLERPYLAVFVDCLEAGDSEHALYEVIMRRIIEEFSYHGSPGAENELNSGDGDPSVIRSSLSQLTTLTLDELTAIHLTVLNAASELAFRSAFASGLRRLLQSANCRLLLIFDEFDDAFRHLPPWPFRQLRAAANQHEDQIQYMVATSHQLDYLRQDDQTYEFRELFQMTTRSLMPLSEQDADLLLQYLDTHEPDPPDAQLRPAIIAASGGHPGLLERIHGLFSQHVVASATAETMDALVRTLLNQNPILNECQRLWQELEEPERHALRQFLQDGRDKLPPQVLTSKGLISSHGSQLFSPLFEDYLNTELLSAPVSTTNKSDGLRLFGDTGQIWAGGQEITWTLASEHQRSLVRLLISKAGDVTTYDEIAEHVYGVGEGVSPGAIRELINRTRKKLPDPKIILNVPGEGYRLKP